MKEMSMSKDRVSELLKNFRSYEWAAKSCGYMDTAERLPLVLSERMRDKTMWDRSRYNRIVNLIKGAVDHVLSDEERTIINRKYLERNRLTLAQIATIMNCDPSTVSRWHTEALKQLAIALAPISDDELEITPFEHKFDPNWTYDGQSA